MRQTRLASRPDSLFRLDCGIVAAESEENLNRYRFDKSKERDDSL